MLMPDELHNWLLLMAYIREKHLRAPTDRSLLEAVLNEVFNSTSFSTGKRPRFCCLAQT